MKNVIYLIVFVLLVFTCKNTNAETNSAKVTQNVNSNSNAQNNNLIREKNETAEDFADRIVDEIPELDNFNLELTNDVVETNNWISNASTIIAFYEKNVNEDDPNDVIGYVFLSADGENYRYSLIDNYFPEGRKANIDTVFFANADKDLNSELIVLCSWKQNLKETANGKIYETRIYDDFSFKRNLEKLVYLENVCEQFGTEFEGFQEGAEMKAKFKTSETIRERLKQLGY